ARSIGRRRQCLAFNLRWVDTMSLIARIIAICLAQLTWLGVAAPASHGEPPRPLADETREFEILAQGKRVGQSRIRITETNNDVITVSTSIAVEFDFLVYVYRYELLGTEVWRGDRLLAVDDQATDNGNKLLVRANLDSHGSIIQTGNLTVR